MITYYYPKTLELVTVALLDMFNDMKVVRYDSSGASIGEKTVPITFGPVEKYHQDRIEDHYVDADGVEHNQRYYLQIPRMALVLNGMSYNADRASGANQWRYWFMESLDLTGSQLDDVLDDGAPNQIVSDYQPTPIDYNFTLHIKCDSMDKLAQILENILPYFNPKLMLRVKEFSFLNVERDLPVSMDAVSTEFIDDQTENDSRYVNASINLTVEGFAYRKFVYSKVIKTINSKYFWHGTGVLFSEYNTSAYQTSGGELLSPTSALPDPEDYFLSGVVSATDTDDKEYLWFKSHSVSGTSAVD